MEATLKPRSFELFDPLSGENGVQYTFKTEAEAIAKADDLGALKFHGLADDQRIEYAKRDGKWSREDGLPLEPPRIDMSVLGPVGTHVEAARDRADQFGLTADIEKLAFEGKTATDIARSLAPKLDPVNEEAPINFVRRVRLSLGIPPLDDQAGFDAWKKRVKTRLSEKESTVIAAVDLPRVDVSALGPVGEQINKAREMADRLGLTADIERMAFSGMTATDIAKALDDKLDPVKAQAIGDNKNPSGESVYFVRQVRMSLGIPPLDDEAAYLAWKAQVAARLKDSVETAPPEAVKAAPERVVLDQATKDKLAVLRARDNAEAREQLGLNAIEPEFERESQPLNPDQETKRAAWLGKADKTSRQQPAGGNLVESDEVFTATGGDVRLIVPPEIEKQYIRRGEKFYHPKNTELVAFEDKGNRLETRSNSEYIAESMVRIAQARGWEEIKVSGTEAFRKEVWMEAAARGMHVKCYTPTEQDKIELEGRLRGTAANTVTKEAGGVSANVKGNTDFRARENEATRLKPATKEAQMAETFRKEPANEGVKQFPELAGAYAVAAALEKKAESDGLSPQQRAVVSERVRQNIVNSIERGDIPEVKIRDQIEVKRDAKEERVYSR